MPKAVQTGNDSTCHEVATRSSVLDFYRKNKIIPVSQDVSDMNRHFEKRESLYRHLGIVPSLVQGRRLIEFGPGTGHNALYMMSLSPSSYTLVDGNEYSVQQIHKNFDNAGIERERYTVEHSLITEYKVRETFDIVLCEGVANIQKKPGELVLHVSGFVKPGGVLVLTCVDCVSFMAENLRRLLAGLIVTETMPIDEQIKRLLPVFKPHLDTLKGMSRLYEDWLLDNVISPDIESFLAIDEVISLLSDEFDFYSSSPRYLQDFRWFKEVDGNYNDNAIGNFLSLMHNHIDYRDVRPCRPVEENLKLRELCTQLFHLVEAYRNGGGHEKLTELIGILDSVCVNLGPAQKTVDSINDFKKMIEIYVQTGRMTPLSDFIPFFGRGQQYISFIRKRTDRV